jgi:hypothetical protein
VTVIDDRSVVEFMDTNLRINIHSLYDFTQAIMLTVTRSAVIKTNESISVNFLTLPMHKTINESLNGSSFSVKNFYPARPFYDYMPMSGQFVFKPTSKTATFLFKIMPNDENFSNNYNKFVKIILLSIENCEGCQLGLNTQAEIYLNTVKYPFRNLLKWSAVYPNMNLVRNEIHLEKPSFIPNYIANFSYTAARFCLTSLTKFPIKVNVYLEQNDTRLAGLVEIDIAASSLFFTKIGSTACVDIGISFNNSENQTFHCYKFNPVRILSLTTQYVINRNFSLYSSVASIDKYALSLFNENCSQISFDRTNLNKFGYKDELLTSLNDQSGDNSSRVQIRLNTNLNYTINIPINIVNNLARFSSFDIAYMIEIDTNLEECIHFITNDNLNPYKLVSKRQIIVNNKKVSQFGLIASLALPNSTDLTMTKALLKFNLVNLNLLTSFYMLNVNISLVKNKTGLMNQYNFDDLSGEPASLSVYFILRPAGVTNDSRICGILSLNKTQSRFSILNAKRQLILLFNNEIDSSSRPPVNASNSNITTNVTTPLSRNCLINVMYDIRNVRGVNIFNFFEESANNFVYFFSTKLNRNLKGFTFY